MFDDNSLLPKEAIRLAALGFACERSRRYAAIAGAVRRFASRICGPSLDLMGSSIALLHTEGLIVADGTGADPPMRITEAGRRELQTLLLTSVRAPSSEVGRLAFALKMRFLHLIGPALRRDQAEMMIAAYQAEIARLEDLATNGSGGPGYFGDWLAHDIALARARRAWLERFRDALPGHLPTAGADHL